MINFIDEDGYSDFVSMIGEGFDTGLPEKINYSHLLRFASLKWEFSVTVRYQKARTVTAFFPGAVTTFRLPRARARKREPNINRTHTRPQDTKRALTCEKLLRTAHKAPKETELSSPKGRP